MLKPTSKESRDLAERLTAIQKQRLSIDKEKDHACDVIITRKEIDEMMDMEYGSFGPSKGARKDDGFLYSCVCDFFIIVIFTLLELMFHHEILKPSILDTYLLFRF